MMMRGVIFDIDGTLLESNDAHAQSWVDAFSEQGMQVPFERVRPLIGMGADHLLPLVRPDLSKTTEPGKTIAQRSTEIFLERYAAQTRPTPGTRPLVEHLHQMGLRLLVATSAKRKELDVLLRQANVADLLTEASTADDASASKPAPDVVSAALEKIQLPASEVAMLGDTVYDIRSAHAAHVAIIAVRCGGSTDVDLAAAEAIYDDPADLLAHLAKSPVCGKP